VQNKYLGWSSLEEANEWLKEGRRKNRVKLKGKRKPSSPCFNLRYDIVGIGNEHISNFLRYLFSSLRFYLVDECS